eukprot:TRINITY_DN11450_c0_g1_i2.p2 TRINITY_DN11450_c0_g1~~TRINITY_DN11450_c0_g1_i2.p2  ORF type:complete len:119 (-),score=9.16 TRINITY_DN11450_c0_g1_i2:509-865(-)
MVRGLGVLLVCTALFFSVCGARRLRGDEVADITLGERLPAFPTPRPPTSVPTVHDAHRDKLNSFLHHVAHQGKHRLTEQHGVQALHILQILLPVAAGMLILCSLCFHLYKTETALKRR